MTFEEARKELEELADGRYYAIQYELTVFANGHKSEVECTVYVDGLKQHFSASTWRGCLDKLKLQSKLDEPTELDLSEAPLCDCDWYG